jgi:osmotically-inducible protein OsmY
MKTLWITLATVAMAATAIAAHADEANYAPPVEKHVAVPSSAAAAHKAMKSADRKLSKAVRKAIVKGGDVDTAHLAVIARGGKVTLTGSVPEEGQVDLAKQHAQSVAGVTEVASRLTVAEPGH